MLGRQAGGRGDVVELHPITRILDESPKIALGGKRENPPLAMLCADHLADWEMCADLEY